MFRQNIRRLCSETLALAVLDRQLVQVIPNKLSVKVDNCELRGLKGNALPMWRLESEGMAIKEISMVRNRDIMRPRDHSMILGLFEMIEKMDIQGKINECIEIPLETGRQERKPAVIKQVSPEGFDQMAPPVPLPATDDINCWMIFYEHPLSTSTSILLISPKMRQVRDLFKTPLRLTNILFKRMSWNFVPPAIYSEDVQLLSDESSLKSILVSESDKVIACPGISITMKRGICDVQIPKTSAAMEIFSNENSNLDINNVIIVASRHSKEIDCFSCWDPDRPADSIVISTSNQIAQNWNEKGADAPSTTGLTFIRFSTSLTDGEMKQEEDGIVVGVSNDFLSPLFSMSTVESDNLSISFIENTEFGHDSSSEDIQDASEPEPSSDFDWLAYIEQQVSETKKQKFQQKSSIKKRHMGDIDTNGPVMTHVETTVKKIDDDKQPEEVIKPSSEVEESERTTVEPRMVNASFGDLQNDSRANDESWEQFVIRIATVMSAVFAHCGRRKRPTLGKDEPASVTITMSVVNEKPSFSVVINEDVCTMELIPQGIDLLTEKLNSRCNNPPHCIPLTLQFSI